MLMEMMQTLKADGCGQNDHSALARDYSKVSGTKIGLWRDSQPFLQVEFTIAYQDASTGCVSGRAARLQFRFEPPAAVFVRRHSRQIGEETKPG